jgi:hypothetical protein
MKLQKTLNDKFRTRPVGLKQKLYDPHLLNPRVCNKMYDSHRLNPWVRKKLYDPYQLNQLMAISLKQKLYDLYQLNL